MTYLHSSLPLPSLPPAPPPNMHAARTPPHATHPSPRSHLPPTQGEGLHPTSVRIASLLPDHYEGNRLNPGLLRQIFTAFLGGKLTLANTGSGAGAATNPACFGGPPSAPEHGGAGP